LARQFSFQHVYTTLINLEEAHESVWLPIFVVRPESILQQPAVVGVTPHSRSAIANLQCNVPERKKHMLWTIAVVLIVLWLLGLVTSYTMGGFLHILLVIAIIMVLVNLISGRRI
jgi:hypothetical protein